MVMTRAVMTATCLLPPGLVNVEWLLVNLTITATTAFLPKQTNLLKISKPAETVANLIMGNAASRDYSIRDAEQRKQQQLLQGSVHIVGRLPAQLVAQHQRNALETQQQRILFEQQRQAMQNQLQANIFHRLGRIEAGVENLNRLAGGGTVGSSGGGISSKKTAKVQTGAHGDPTQLTQQNLKTAAEQAAAASGAKSKSKSSAKSVPAEAVQAPEGFIPAGDRHRRAFAPPTHGSRVLGMHRGPPSRATRARARAVRTRLGWN
ncbi:uncharacterized protein MYCFIDRAFT_175328 [Pseudocercospora fijiensis CIRAD86]|uniref:Uncharacterized protein n=1 Tax=Pseudocercospora fijiensis (strain CIRAD86) TaxID=383855 RepID=M2YVP1_PSEFD|nr:uncharacterized protein MYCFIDRAFT_175328 [Pseudocercospora fijiensis CIRAD86]EME81750.1 hypothetical protein MYCFIDRAFT_175328 [Pseudocercospora fijiensis CIRAD86]